jgi:hypothetical protein
MFIASSVEGIEIAKSIQLNLQHSLLVELWNQEQFPPSESTLDSLLHAAGRFDFGMFVFSPDDRVTSRRQMKMAARDNVLFECGLFFGRLGRSRCFFLVPDSKNFKIASDLYGITPVKYSVSALGHQKLSANVGPACTTVERAITATFKENSPAESLTGTWEQFWKPTKPTKTYRNGSGSKAQVKQIGNVFHATCADDGHTFVAEGCIEKGNFVTGTWKSPASPTYYSGAFQLHISPRLDRMEGMWVGHKKDNSIDSGEWVWTRADPHKKQRRPK